MLRAVIIGTGQIGKIHANAMKKSSLLDLVGFMGNKIENTKAVAGDYGVQAFESIDSLDEEKIDIAIVATPSYIRKEIIYKLIDKNINILCEKPFALSYKEGLAMANYAEDKDIKIMIGQVIRFWPAYVKIKEIIVSGKLGEVIHIYSNRLSKHPSWTSWHKDPKKSGGGLFDLAIHDLDYLVHLFGKVDSVDALGRKDENFCYNFTISNLKFKNGNKGTVESNMDLKGDYPFTSNLRVVGTKGTLEYESRHQSLILYEEDDQPRLIEIENYDPYLRQMDYLGQAIRENKEIEIISMDQVLHVLNLLENIKISIEEDRRVKISEESV